MIPLLLTVGAGVFAGWAFIRAEQVRARRRASTRSSADAPPRPREPNDPVR